MNTHPRRPDNGNVTFTESDVMSTQPTRRSLTAMARLVFGWERPAVRAWAARLIWGDAPMLWSMVPAGALGIA